MKIVNCKLKIKRGFTLIEILVVATIIVLLTATASVTYSTLLKQSRDAKRKVDLEQVRAALEMYRSNNNIYPASGWANLSALTTPVIYIQSLPSDPKTPYQYDYDALPSGCTTACNNYTLGSKLEQGGTNCTGTTDDCESTAGTQSCNYCLGPYGQK